MAPLFVVSTTILVVSTGLTTTAFQPSSTTAARSCRPWKRPSFVAASPPHRQRPFHMSAESSDSPSFEDLLQSEVLLGEGKAVSEQVQNMIRTSGDQSDAEAAPQGRRRQQVTVVPDEWPEQMRTHTVSSSTVSPYPSSKVSTLYEDDGEDEGELDSSDLSNDELASRLERGTSLLNDEGEESTSSESRYSARLENAIRSKQIQKGQLEKPTLNDRVADMMRGASFGDYFLIVGVPMAGVYFTTNVLYGRATRQVSGKFTDILESYANEMIFHSADFDEMKLCHKDYNRKLVLMGPKKTDAMLKCYLDAFAKRKTVSPSNIRSLSEVLFNIYKLSEDRAVKAIVELCLSEPDKVASASKFLLMGNAIFSAEVRPQLEALRTMLAQSYSGGDFAKFDTMELVDRSQRGMMEAAYRAAVIAEGEGQTSLTPGWDLLGLDEETAMEIFEKAAEDEFVSDLEARKKSQSELEEKYGLDKEKKKQGEGSDDEDDDDDDDDEPMRTSNAYSCSNCGFTLFVAPGRESVMFGPSFTCPECGASKDQFKSLEESE